MGRLSLVILVVVASQAAAAVAPPAPHSQLVGFDSGDERTSCTPCIVPSNEWQRLSVIGASGIHAITIEREDIVVVMAGGPGTGVFFVPPPASGVPVRVTVEAEGFREQLMLVAGDPLPLATEGIYARILNAWITLDPLPGERGVAASFVARSQFNDAEGFADVRVTARDGQVVVHFREGASRWAPAVGAHGSLIHLAQIDAGREGPTVGGAGIGLCAGCPGADSALHVLAASRPVALLAFPGRAFSLEGGALSVSSISYEGVRAGGAALGLPASGSRTHSLGLSPTTIVMGRGWGEGSGELLVGGRPALEWTEDDPSGLATLRACAKNDLGMDVRLSGTAEALVVMADTWLPFSPISPGDIEVSLCNAR